MILGCLINVYRIDVAGGPDVVDFWRGHIIISSQKGLPPRYANIPLFGAEIQVWLLLTRPTVLSRSHPSLAIS